MGKSRGTEILMGELAQSLILRNLKAGELRLFADMCEERVYAGGERFVTQGSLENELFIVLEGEADILVRSPEGNDVPIGNVTRGDVLGEASIFLDVPRTASAVAKRSCRLAAVPRDRLFGFCDANPRAGLKIFTFVIYSLLRRLGSTSLELAHQRDTTVTSKDLELLMKEFPKSLEGILAD